MTGFVVSIFPFRNRVSSKEAFEGLELDEGKPSRPVVRRPGGRKGAWLLGMWFVAQRERGHIPVNPNVFPASFLSSLRYLDKAKGGSQNTRALRRTPARPVL